MDTSSIAQLIVIVILLILSAFFSASETALTTVNKLRLRSLADEGSKRASKVLSITESSGKLLSTILIGNNIVNISASALTTTLCTQVFGSKFIGISTGILTLVVLIFGEITPKSLATLYATEFSLFVVYPIWTLSILLTPAVWLLNGFTSILFKLFRIKPDANSSQITESELRTIVTVSHEEGVIEPEERFMISNVVDFGDALSRDIMIPRADVVFIDKNATYEEIVETFKKETYSRIPVYEDTKDNVIGIICLKDLFFYMESKGDEEFDITKILREPNYVYEYERTSQIFADMKVSSLSLAIVLDEYGVSIGLITMEDLIEEIVGEIRDEYDDDENELIKEISENVYDIEASIKLDDLNDAIGTTLSSEDYDSLGGLVIELLDKLPSVGDEATLDNISFKVTRVLKNRVERITVTITDTGSECASETE